MFVLDQILQDIQSFICPNCEYSQHQCFVCGKLGSSSKSSHAEVQLLKILNFSWFDDFIFVLSLTIIWPLVLAIHMYFGTHITFWYVVFEQSVTSLSLLWFLVSMWYCRIIWLLIGMKYNTIVSQSMP